MPIKSTKPRRAAPRKRRKLPLINKSKRHPWTRKDGEIHRAGYKIGYARASTLDQNLALRQDALKEAGRQHIYVEQMSGAVTDRPALPAAMLCRGQTCGLPATTVEGLRQELGRLN
jgi:hypothetical protein